MADVSKQTMTSIAAAMVAKAAADTKGSAKGIVGGVIEGITGQIRDYNEALEKHGKIVADVAEAESELAQVSDELEKAQNALELQVHELGGGTEELEAKIAKLVEREEELKKAHSKATMEMRKSGERMKKLTKKSGILSNGMGVLAAKVAGAATAFFSFKSALESIDKRLGFTAKQIQLTSDFTGGYGDAMKYAWEEGNRWNDVINENNMALAKMGIGVEETNTIMHSLADGLRLSANDADKMRDMVSQGTKDIAHMSALLGTTTEELATATTTASKKFGTTTQEMADDLAGMWDAMKDVQQGSKDTVVHLGDLTKAVLEQQGSFQGYNLNLRQQASLMANISREAQEQGASYEMSMKAAKGLTDILTGGAPDWAKYVAGQDLLKEMKSVGKKAGETAEEYGARIQKEFGFDPSTKAGQERLKGMENLVKNQKKYGKLSASYMAEELMRGTEAGTDAMMKLLKKYGTGSEGREMLKRVWGLDDAAATAAMLALESENASADFKKIVDEAKQKKEDKKPPTMKDVREQTQEMVNAYGMAKSGIGKTLAGIKDAILDRPWLNVIVGAIGGFTSTILQLMQLRQATGGIGDLLEGGPTGGRGGIRGRLGRMGRGIGRGFRGAGRGIGGLARGAGRLAMGAGRGLGGLAMRGGGMAISGVSKLLPLAATGLKAAAGLAGPAAAVAAAGAAGYALGTALRKLFPQIDTFTEGLMNSTAKLLGFEHAMDDQEVANEALKNKSVGVQRAIAQAIDAVNNISKEGSYEFMVGARQLKQMHDEDLKAYAEQIHERTGMDEEEAFNRLKKLRDTKVDDKKFLEARKEMIKAMSPAELEAKIKSDVARGGKEADVRAEYEAIRTGKKAGPAAEAAKKQKPKEKAPPVVTVTKLSPAQRAAVAKNVATELSPEVAELGAGLFEQMSTQSGEFFTSMMETSNFFWKESLPTLATEAFASVVKSFDKKLTDIAGPMAGMMPLAEAGGEGGMGGVGVGPDGSILVKFMIPRDAIDKSKRQTASQVE